MTIGKITRVPLREVWKHEAYGLTTWLQQNVDVLNEVMDLQLTNVEKEQDAGSFSVDLVAEDSGGNAVVIENQLEKSDHDHLGKLLTYLVAIEAKTAIWIVAEPRPEHVSAIAWLNESTAASFYLLKIEAIRIGDSAPAPLLTLIVGPSDESKEAGRTKQELAGRYIVRKRFWTALLERSRKLTNLHSTISPGQYSWIGTSAGKAGLNLNYVVRKHSTHAELYIDRGRDSDEENKRIYEILNTHAKEIESAFGGALEWDAVPGRRACRIRSSVTSGGYLDEEKWPQIQDLAIDAMIRLEKALRPHINSIQIAAQAFQA